MYASAVCSGKVTPGGKKKKKKATGGRITMNKGGIARGCGKVANNRRKNTTYVMMA